MSQEECLKQKTQIGGVVSRENLHPNFVVSKHSQLIYKNISNERVLH